MMAGCNNSEDDGSKGQDDLLAGLPDWRKKAIASAIVQLGQLVEEFKAWRTANNFPNLYIYQGNIEGDIPEECTFTPEQNDWIRLFEHRFQTLYWMESYPGEPYVGFIFDGGRKVQDEALHYIQDHPKNDDEE